MLTRVYHPPPRQPRLETILLDKSMQDGSVAPTVKKKGEIAPDSAMASFKSPLGEHGHLPAVRISDSAIGVQPTAEWTQPPPGLIGSDKKDDDPIESFSGSPLFYHQQQISDGNMQVALNTSKNISQFPLAPIVEDDDEIQISSALSAVSLGNQKGSNKNSDKIDASKGNKLTRQHPYLRSNDRQVNQEHKDLSQVSTGSTIDQLLQLGGHRRSPKNALSQSTSGDRRSKSADWNSAGVSKRTKKLVSSKSCPPSRSFHLGKKFLKLLPRLMEVIDPAIEKLMAMKLVGIRLLRP